MRGESVCFPVRESSSTNSQMCLCVLGVQSECGHGAALSNRYSVCEHQHCARPRCPVLPAHARRVDAWQHDRCGHQRLGARPAVTARLSVRGTCILYAALCLLCVYVGRDSMQTVLSTRKQALSRPICITDPVRCSGACLRPAAMCRDTSALLF